MPQTRNTGQPYWYNASLPERRISFATLKLAVVRHLRSKMSPSGCSEGLNEVSGVSTCSIPTAVSDILYSRFVQKEERWR
jgi:hypothetical protein